jgi:hypothetical protein
MKLSDAENAVVDLEKLRSYALDPTHRVGRHKARFAPPCPAWVLRMQRSYATFYSTRHEPLTRSRANTANMVRVTE